MRGGYTVVDFKKQPLTNSLVIPVKMNLLESQKIILFENINYDNEVINIIPTIIYKDNSEIDFSFKLNETTITVNYICNETEEFFEIFIVED